MEDCKNIAVHQEMSPLPMVKVMLINILILPMDNIYKVKVVIVMNPQTVFI